MLNLKFAEAFVDLYIERRRYDASLAKVRRELDRFPGKLAVELTLNTGSFSKQLASVQAELGRLKSAPVRITVDRGAATAALNLVRQQAQTMQRKSFGVVPIRADLKQWRVAMKEVAFDLYRVRRFAQIPVSATTSSAHASVNLLIQQLKTAQGLTKFRMSASGGMGGGRGGSGGGGFGGGSQFLQGLGMSAGLPFASSPQMMLGNMVGGGLAGAVRTGVGIETQMAELRRVTGMKPGEIETHKQGLFDIGTRQAGVSMDDLMEMSNIGGHAGVVDREGAGGLLKFTQELAMVKNSIADMSTDELATKMVQVLNNFELGTDRVASFGSALTAMDNVSVASAKDILDITNRLSGTANAIGMTLPQITAFSSVLKDVGISNEIAGSSFSQIFRLMGSKSSEFAEKIGVDAETFANAYRRDPMEALGMVITKFNEMKDTITGQEFLDELGLKGVRTAGSLQQLATKFGEVGKRAAVASAETGSLNALLDANAIKGDTAASAMGKLGVAWTQLGEVVSKPLLGPMTDAINALTAIIKSTTSGKGNVLAKTVGAGAMDVLGMMVPGANMVTKGARKGIQGSLDQSVYDMLYGASDLGPAQKMPALPPKNPNLPAGVGPIAPLAPQVQAQMEKAANAGGGIDNVAKANDIGGRIAAAVDQAGDVFGERTAKATERSADLLEKILAKGGKAANIVGPPRLGP